MVGRAGGSYLTATQLQLRADHAAARDAVSTELLLTDLPSDLVESTRLVLLETCARSKQEYLLAPELGRKLAEASRSQLATRNARGVDLQLVIGDGLSATAVRRQVPLLLPGLLAGATARGWSCGLPIALRYCRVGILNDIGDLLAPRVVVLLIGERPGLATAESLSAYMAYAPCAGQTDANRNLISNIHARGLPPAAAIPRILDLVAQLLEQRTSGVSIKERLGQAFPVSSSPLLDSNGLTKDAG